MYERYVVWMCDKEGCNKKETSAVNKLDGWNTIRLNDGEELVYCWRHIVSIEVKDRCRVRLKGKKRSKR